jgi:proline racemase
MIVLEQGGFTPMSGSNSICAVTAMLEFPCGTGTCARMAALYARGQLAIGEKFSHRSILGSEFIGELTGTTTVGSFPAVLPTITGTAWVTGHSRWLLDDTDPYPTGYTVGDIWAPQP